MKKQIKAVEEFMTVFGQDFTTRPTTLTPAQARLRYDLMKEENEEFLEACDKYDMVEIADALGDQLYILMGTILSCGMQHIIEDVFKEIHESNMSKLEDGKVLYRNDGKVLKGKDYFPPNIKKFLNND